MKEANMKKPVTLTIGADLNIKGLLAKVKHDARQYGINFNGNEERGSGAGHGMKARYSVKDNRLTILVEQKPWYVSVSRIRQEIANYCGEFVLKGV
jgi:hypothetical protein